MLFRKISGWHGRKGGNREKEKRTPILLFPYFHALLSVLGAPLSKLRGFNGYWARKREKEKVPQVNNNVKGKVYYYLRTGYYLEGWGNEEGIFVVRGNWK